MITVVVGEGNGLAESKARMGVPLHAAVTEVHSRLMGYERREGGRRPPYIYVLESADDVCEIEERLEMSILSHIFNDVRRHPGGWYSATFDSPESDGDDAIVTREYDGEGGYVVSGDRAAVLRALSCTTPRWAILLEANSTGPLRGRNREAEDWMEAEEAMGRDGRYSLACELGQRYRVYVSETDSSSVVGDTGAYAVKALFGLRGQSGGDFPAERAARESILDGLAEFVTTADNFKASESAPYSVTLRRARAILAAVESATTPPGWA